MTLSDARQGRGKRSRLRAGATLSCLAAALLAGFAAVSQEAPGASPDGRSVVAGQVSSQYVQAQTAPVTAFGDAPATFDWWEPGAGRRLPEFAAYGNGWGEVGVYNAGGPVETKGHPFFEPIGQNGRACVSCHQPADGMSLSVRTIQERWRATGGKDPIFAAVDGANCPHLPQGDPASHSLLLKRGLFRVFLPWPPKGPDDRSIDPEFDIEVVRDPGGCNTHPTYGLKSPNPMVSVYRRPRPVANMKYVTHQGFGVDVFRDKDAMLAVRDPETGKAANMNMMSDARHATLKTQAVEAAVAHLQFDGVLSPDQLTRIKAFEDQVYVAQTRLNGAGSLIDKDGPPAFGPYNMFKGKEGQLGNNTDTFVFPMGQAWTKPEPGETARQRDMRASVRRGHDVFFLRTFWIRDSMHLNTVGFGNPTKRTCATCHQMHMMGMDVANGWVDIGTVNLPWAKEEPRNPWTTDKPEMPLFKITCKPGVAAHPFLGRVFYTQDPGRALITGKCNDVGAIVMQQFRGLAARAPYFVNGSAADLREMIDYYDRRYNIGYTEREKTDLENFLASL
jgi:hypothetical protein